MSITFEAIGKKLIGRLDLASSALLPGLRIIIIFAIFYCGGTYILLIIAL